MIAALFLLVPTVGCMILAITIIVTPICSFGESRSWQSLLWGTESLPISNTTVVSSSVLLPQAGFAILRAGTSGPLYLAFDFGPHAGWHGHYDKLGYVTAGLGGMLGTDPGAHGYMLPLHDAWDRTTVAHNTVVVDEINQSEVAGELRRFVGLPLLSLATANAGPSISQSCDNRADFGSLMPITGLMLHEHLP